MTHNINQVNFQVCSLVSNLVKELFSVATPGTKGGLKKVNAYFFLCHFSRVFKESFVLCRGCGNNIILSKSLILFSSSKMI